MQFTWEALVACTKLELLFSFVLQRSYLSLKLMDAAITSCVVCSRS